MADEVIWEIGGRECDNYKIAELDIGEDNYLPHDCDWEVLGRAIGNSMHIKELSLCGNFCDFGANIKKEHLLALLPGFTLNRSITKLTFAGLDLNDKVGRYPSASRVGEARSGSELQFHFDCRLCYCPFLKHSR